MHARKPHLYMVCCRVRRLRSLGTLAEPWHSGGASSRAEGERTGSSGTGGSIPEECRLFLSSMVQHPVLPSLAPRTAVAGVPASLVVETQTREPASRSVPTLRCPVPHVLAWAPL